MNIVISVRPSAEGWIVSREGIGREAIFPSGARAEAAARRLMDELSGQGEAAELHIYLKDGTLAGRFVGQAPEPELA